MTILLLFYTCMTSCQPEILIENTDLSLTQVAEKGSISFGYDIFAPFAYRDSENMLTGFDIDVMTEIAARLCLKLKPVKINWLEKEKKLTADEVDMIMGGVSSNENSAATYCFSTPYMSNRQMVVVPKISPVSNGDQLDGARVGIRANSSIAAADKAKALDITFAKITSETTVKDLFNNLDNNQIDAIILDVFAIDYYFENGGNRDNYKILPDPLFEEQYVMGFNVNDVALMKKMETVMYDMVVDGKLEELSKKWFKSNLITLEEKDSEYDLMD